MFEQLRHRLSVEVKSKKELFVLEPLLPEDVTGLNLSWNSHFNTSGLRNHLRSFPGLSWRVPGSNEYIIGDNWRRREDVGQIIETRGRSRRLDLVERLVLEFRLLGCGAVVVGTDEQSDNTRFYKEAGFTEIERIVYYEKPDAMPRFDYRFQPLKPLLNPFTDTQLEALLVIDHAAFPWLWWNSQSEIEHYVKQEGVVVYLAYLSQADGSQIPAGYFGFTLYERWAHLDRLAVVPELQGQHLGGYQLAFALELMSQRGARRVTLSTQENNHQSQRLYERFGFRRVRSLEYNLVGKWLRPNL